MFFIVLSVLVGNPICDCEVLPSTVDTESVRDYCQEQTWPGYPHAEQVAVAMTCGGVAPPNCEPVTFWPGVSDAYCCYY